MKQTTAPSLQTPSPSGGPTKSQAAGKTKTSSMVFISAALDMSWRLAVVVLVPIIGGFKLDQHWHTTPLLTVIGFGLAMGGMALVLKQMLQAVNQVPVSKRERHS